MFTRILLATDGSCGALKAAETAAGLAKAFGATITVMHVFTLPPSFTPYVGAPGAEINPVLIQRYAEEVQAAVSRRTGHVLEQAGVAYETREEFGHPADTIVHIAEDEKFDLIVLGSRGMSEFRRFMLGSVSDRVSHHAHCPVLIVK